ncbi:unnamed protein product [Urochloa decumbens]|uniref:DUF1677 family protein n=1 Tax=Urochloa decumbens TaxID=240449 RepID=A0ABC8WGN6_9POAL
MPWRLARQTETPTGDDPAAEARSVRCECCGMAEECTPTYIGRVRERFQGKWVCGLCAEAVKERQARDPGLVTVARAVEAHAAMCERFNSTVRLNPKLSLASSMRDIARKSGQNRRRRSISGTTAAATATGPPTSACGGDSKLARAASCAFPYV